MCRNWQATIRDLGDCDLVLRPQLRAHGSRALEADKVRNTTSIDTEIGWECALTNNSNWRCSTYSHHTSHSVSRTCKVKAKRICGRRRRSRRRAPAALGAAARLALGIGPWPRLLSQPSDPSHFPHPPHFSVLSQLEGEPLLLQPPRHRLTESLSERRRRVPRQQPGGGTWLGFKGWG